MTQRPFQPDDELLSAYIDGELTADELRAVEDWIASDPAAQALVEELRNVSSTVQSLPRTSVPAEWTAQLAQRLDEAAGTKTPGGPKHESNGQGGGIASLPIGRSKRGWWFSAAAVAAAVAIMLLLPQDVNDQVAVNDPALKAPAEGAAIGNRSTNEVPEMSAADEPADATADRSLEAMATEDMPLAESAAEPFTPESTPEVSDFAGMIPAPATAPAPAGTNIGGNSSNAYLIVWCDVPPETLRQREINNVLGDNGIVVEEQTESWLAAAEPVRQQIELRNNNYEAGRGGFGGGVASSGVAEREAVDQPASRFSVPDRPLLLSARDNEARNQPTASEPVPEDSPAEGTAAAEADADGVALATEEKDKNDVEIEGETILVDARADQIAACLAAMQSDPGSYSSITVEPVSEAAIAEQLAERQRMGVRAEQPGGVSFRAMVPDNTTARTADAELYDLADDSLPAQQAARQSTQLEQNLAQQAQRPQARRLERPEAWYFYNTAPQNEQEVIRLPVANQSASKTMVQGKVDAGNKQAELAELNRLVEQQQQVSAKKSLPVPLQEQQPVQVLFVLRNSLLPTLTESPAAAGEIQPAEAADAAEAGPAPAAESP